MKERQDAGSLRGRGELKEVKYIQKVGIVLVAKRARALVNIACVLNELLV